MAVNHVVYFKFKKEATPEQIKAHMLMFQQLSETIPGIVSYSAGKAFKVKYEGTADFDCMHCVTCESEKALEAYFFHEDHKKFIKQNEHIWENAMVLNSNIEVY